MTNYKIYLVGGAVRDALLNRTVNERDWVVVGAHPEDLREQGYKQVGKDFPVFLHPISKEEYALARSERKVAAGYTGFEVDASPDITLEEDLLRRDLTINAIAQDQQGHYIDPYNGIQDIDNRILRHVSDAFAEDPVRVLRLARFYARYKPYGFSIAPETKALVQVMIDKGELEYLVPERIWAELHKALSEKMPYEFFNALRELNCLSILFPELDALFGVPQTAKYHPEVDSGIHTLMALDQIATITDDLPTRFAVLCHDFGKAVTPKEEWPSHRHHEMRGVPLTRAFCERLKVPNEYRDIALKVTQYHLLMHDAMKLRPKTLVNLIIKLDAIRRPVNLYRFIDACMADARGRLGFSKRPYPQREFLIHILNTLRSMEISNIIKDVDKERIPEIIKQKRIEVITEMIKDYTTI